jgi:hypothetical protein
VGYGGAIIFRQWIYPFLSIIFNSCPLGRNELENQYRRIPDEPFGKVVFALL